MNREPTFYVWEHWSTINGDYDTECEAVGEIVEGEAPRCPDCGTFLGGIAWLPPYRIRLIARGRSGIGDVAYAVDDIFTSDRFRAGAEEFGLKGLTFIPAEVVAIKRRRRLLSMAVPHFHHCEISRGTAAVDVARSELQVGPVQCPTCRTMREVVSAVRVVIEPGTWEGLDAFIPRGLPGTTLVTERFVHMCRQYGITNMQLTSAESYRLQM